MPGYPSDEPGGWSAGATDQGTSHSRSIVNRREKSRYAVRWVAGLAVKGLDCNPSAGGWSVTTEVQERDQSLKAMG